MKTKIRPLSEKTINQIAAGEVIEDPTSVLKELIENALDAGATLIEMAWEDSGFTRLSVADNGCGIGKEDLPLAPLRHATSKIAQLEDLEQLSTMGFRGEALASIAAISKMCIRTHQSEGLILEVHGGQVMREGPIARARGTTIRVSSLFYNVPARLKFQKTPSRMHPLLMRLVTHFALANPSVGFSVSTEKGEIFAVNPESLDERIVSTLGKDYVAKGRMIDKSTHGMQIKGMLGSPHKTRVNRLGQYLFMNGRLVTCPEIVQAVIQGYGTRIAPRTYPNFVLHMELPPHSIDVNVHPQKKEIRLRQPIEVQEFVSKSISESFQTVSQVSFTPKMGTYATPSFPMRLQETPHEDEPLDWSQLLEMRPIGFFQQLFFLEGDQLFFVHLGRARSRVMQGKEESEVMQNLLVPIHILLTPLEMTLLQAKEEEIRAHGVGVRPFGEDRCIIDALIPSLPNDRAEELVHHLLGGGEDLGRAIRRFTNEMPSRYTVEEAQELIKELLRCDEPAQCPDGRPIFGQIEKHELKRFYL